MDHSSCCQNATAATKSTAAAVAQDCHLPTSTGAREIVLLAIILTVIGHLGIVANIINFRVFSTKKMRHSPINLYLAALSVSDLGVLVSGLLMLSFPAIASGLQNLDLILISRYIIRWVYPLAMIAQTASVWLLTVTAVYRFIGISYPFVSQKMCTRGKAKCSIVLIALFSVIYNASRFNEMTLIECREPLTRTSFVDLDVSRMRQNQFYQLVYCTLLYFLILFFFPFLILSYVNVRTIYAVRMSRRLHSFRRRAKAVASPQQQQQLQTDSVQLILVKNGAATQSITSTSTSCASGKQQQLLHHKHSIDVAHISRKTSADRNKSASSTTTVILIAVVFVFLFCNITAFVCNIIEASMTYILSKESVHTVLPLYHTMVDISNVLVAVNSSMNILIYLWFSRQYRALLMAFCSGSGSRQQRGGEQQLVLNNHSRTAVRSEETPPSHPHNVNNSRVAEVCYSSNESSTRPFNTHLSRVNCI